MAYQLEDFWRRALVSQIFVIVYSVIAAFLGINFRTFLLVLVFVILATYVQSRLSRKDPLGGAAVSTDLVMSGKKLYEEKNVREIQMKDAELMRDMQPQFRYMMWLNLALFVGLAYFFLAWGRVESLKAILMERVNNEIAAAFLAFLIYMEGFFIINQLAMYGAMVKAGKVPFITYPNEYVITEKGIVFRGLLSSTAIGFPLPSGVSIRLDESRGFVDLVKEGKRSVSVIRLYSRAPKRLYELLRRHAARGEGA